MKIHSAVGLITNSSTSTYTTADVDAPEAYKQFINKILQMAGSNYTADDLVNITREQEFDEEYAVDALPEYLEELEPNHPLFAALTPDELAILQDDERSGRGDWWQDVTKIVDRLAADPTTRELVPQNTEHSAHHVYVRCKKTGEDIECIQVHIDSETYPC